MTTVQIEYVGKKESEKDHNYGTGIEWIGAGDVKEVPADKWELMKKHTDVWREAATARTVVASQQKMAEQPKPTTVAPAAAQEPEQDKIEVTVTSPTGRIVKTVIDGKETDPGLAEENAKIAATLADLDSMTDEAVRKFASSLRVSVHHKKTGPALRAAVRQALAA
jgi:hypothetical protein